jgi:hypothetical protein
MKRLMKNPRSLMFSLAIVLTINAVSFGAHAGLLYNSYADLEFNLVNVARVGGQGNNNGEGPGPGDGEGPGENSYSVVLNGSIFGSDAFTTGSGFASFFTSIITSSDYQTSESDGSSSGTGSASSYADTGFSITFQNNHKNPLSFDLSFLSYVSAEIYNDALLAPSDDAGAYAEISLFDDVTEILFSSAEAFVGGEMFSSEEIEQSLSFQLEAGESYEIYGTVYSDGYAVTVPEPSMLWLMALSLMAILVKNHKRSNNRIKNID